MLPCARQFSIVYHWLAIVYGHVLLLLMKLLGVEVTKVKAWTTTSQPYGAVGQSYQSSTDNDATFQWTTPSVSHAQSPQDVTQADSNG